MKGMNPSRRSEIALAILAAYAGNQFDLAGVRMDSGPAGGRWLKEQGVDVVLLTPV